MLFLFFPLLYSFSMVSKHFPSAIIALSMVLALSGCARVPYGDQLPVTPDIPRDQLPVNETPLVESGDCPQLNTDPATTSITYTNAEMGISFPIPYNDQWGYTGMPLPAFSEHAGDGISLGHTLFGPPTSGSLEGLGGSCDPIQYYSLTFLPARTANAAVHAVESQGVEVVPNATVQTINGMTVVRYTDVGLCSYPTLEVVGQTYNYSFTTSCGGDPEADWKYLENIVKSVTLTK